MAKYRYIFADLLTDQVTVELPLYGTTFSRRICKVGEFGGSFGLNTEGIANRDVINGTVPGRTAVYIERDSQLVWGGIVWSRTWQEQSRSFQYYGQTFDSYLYLSDIRNTIQYVDVDQRNIVINLLQKSQEMPYRGLRIGTPPTFPNNIVRSPNFFWYDAWTYGKAFEYMAEFEDGLDYYIDVAYDAFGDFSRRLVVDDRIGSPLDDTQLVFDFPGSIKNFWYPENASKGATTISGIGAGEGAASIRALAVKQELLDGGHPELVQFYTNKDIKTLSTLQSHLAQEMRLLSTPVVQPTYEIESDRDPVFGSYALGDHAKIKLDSVRFETPLELTTRIVGWDVKPTQSSGAEEVKIITAGEED